MAASRTSCRFIFPLLGTALALATVCSCGSGSGSDAAPGAGGDSKPLAGATLSPAQLAKAAQKEGRVTWYTTFSDADVQPMIAGFNKEYPGVKVNALRLSADKIPPRVITEQRGGQHNADVVSGDSPQIAQLLQAGALQPYDPSDAPPLPSGLKLPKGYKGVVYAVTTSIAYNPTVLKKKGLTPPKSWEDLTTPRWKGQFSVDPSAVNWYDSLIASMGHDKALDLMKKLGDNKPRFVESHTLSLTQTQSGEPAVAATAYGYKASTLKKDTPQQLDFVNPNPLPSSLNLIDIVKDAPHPNAAMLFDDWMVSKAGQQAVAGITNHTSIREDVKNDPTVWDEKTWQPSWGRPNLPSNEYNDLVKEMKSALKAP